MNLPCSKQLLRVETDYFVAGAIWEKIDGAWSCTHAAPIIYWMKSRSPQQTAAALEKMGAHYQFTPAVLTPRPNPPSRPRSPAPPELRSDASPPSEPRYPISSA